MLKKEIFLRISIVFIENKKYNKRKTTDAKLINN